MATDLNKLAKDLLFTDLEDLTEREKQVLEKFVSHRRISRNVNREFDQETTFGERLADRVAQFGGSWTFIILFAIVLLVWTGGNLLMAAFHTKPFDPYPFIFLNLVLSMLAAVQAPIIMMSQNRQGDKDRASAAHDYEVNLKAELEIMQLHEKIDLLRLEQMNALLREQAAQTELLKSLMQAGR